MKRFCLWIAVLLSVLTLCGCQNKEDPGPYDVAYDGKTYTVDQEQGTITCDGVVYQFEVSSRGGDSVELDITYPDGSRYYWTMDGSFGHGGWSDDYDPEGSGYVRETSCGMCYLWDRPVRSAPVQAQYWQSSCWRWARSKRSRPGRRG